jgi:membrane protease subunit (stomatin/prohibitin family)
MPFLAIIESVSVDPNILMWKYQNDGKDISHGAKLIVRESQIAMLLSDGIIADIFLPGHYTLDAENMPSFARVKGWKYGFKNPFKADLYFFNTHQFLNLKWGTPAPIMMSDAVFGQVRVRAFGVYSLNINDAAVFFRRYAGTFPTLTIDVLERQLRDFIAPKFGETLARRGYSVKDVAGDISALSGDILPELKPFFDELGLELTKFQITSVTLPESVNVHYDTLTGMNIIGDMDRFRQFNAAQAAKFAEPTTSVEVAQDDIVAKLKQLKVMFESQLIDEDEFKRKKAQLLSQL